MWAALSIIGGILRSLYAGGVKITVIGLGYLGATHAIAMAELGHEVIGIDQDLEKVESLSSGRLPIFEPGLEELLLKHLDSGRLLFSAAHDRASESAEAHFLCVGTPQSSDNGSADLSYLFSAVDQLSGFLGRDAVVIGKSTVPVGTAELVRERVAKLTGRFCKLAWNPEFLREGSALEDSLNPDRIVVGASSSAEFQSVRDIYSGLIEKGIPYLEMDLTSAELVKVSANAFLATKISFINAIAEICEKTGADIREISSALGLDTRIGPGALRSGIGFGGGCLPKDLRSLRFKSKELGAHVAGQFFDGVEAVNDRMRSRGLELALEELGDPAGKKVHILGIAFKAGTDDLRDSPPLELAKQLVKMGAKVLVSDPQAASKLRSMENGLEAAETLEVGFHESDLTVLGTDWPEFLQLDPSRSQKLVRASTVLDLRNALDTTKWESCGWRVRAVGKRS